MCKPIYDTSLQNNAGSKEKLGACFTNIDYM